MWVIRLSNKSRAYGYKTIDRTFDDRSLDIDLKRRSQFKSIRAEHYADHKSRSDSRPPVALNDLLANLTANGRQSVLFSENRCPKVIKFKR